MFFLLRSSLDWYHFLPCTWWLVFEWSTWSAKRVCSGSSRCPQRVQMAEQSCSSRTSSPPHSGQVRVMKPRGSRGRTPGILISLTIPAFDYKYPARLTLPLSHPAIMSPPASVNLQFQSKSSTAARRRLSSSTGKKPDVKAYASLTVNIDHRTIVRVSDLPIAYVGRHCRSHSQWGQGL